MAVATAAALTFALAVLLPRALLHPLVCFCTLNDSANALTHTLFPSCLCCVAVLVLISVAPNLARPRLAQLTPAMMQGACIRGPDLHSLPPCPQAFIDRWAFWLCLLFSCWRQ